MAEQQSQTLVPQRFGADILTIDEDETKKDGKVSRDACNRAFRAFCSRMVENCGFKPTAEGRDRIAALTAKLLAYGTSADTNFEERLLVANNENSSLQELKNILYGMHEFQNRDNAMRLFARSFVVWERPKEKGGDYNFADLTMDVISMNGGLTDELVKLHSVETVNAKLMFDYADTTTRKLTPAQLALIKTAFRLRVGEGRSPFLLAPTPNGNTDPGTAPSARVTSILPNPSRAQQTPGPDRSSY